MCVSKSFISWQKGIKNIIKEKGVHHKTSRATSDSEPQKPQNLPKNGKCWELLMLVYWKYSRTHKSKGPNDGIQIFQVLNHPTSNKLKMHYIRVCIIQSSSWVSYNISTKYFITSFVNLIEANQKAAGEKQIIHEQFCWTSMFRAAFLIDKLKITPITPAICKFHLYLAS